MLAVHGLRRLRHSYKLRLRVASATVAAPRTVAAAEPIAGAGAARVGHLQCALEASRTGCLEEFDDLWGSGLLKVSSAGGLSC